MSQQLLRELNPRQVVRRRRPDRRRRRALELRRAGEGEATAIEVDKSAKILYVLGGNRIVASFPISIGGPLDPLPLGRMKIVNKVKTPSYTYDPALLRDAKPGTNKTQLPPGPNSPVGTTWLGLSKPHWGIHGSPDPERLGSEETNGCIHLTNWDAERLSTLAKAGLAVDVHA